MTNHFVDYKNADAILMIGSNTAENHPMAMRWIGRAKAERGAKLIVVDPRFSRSAAKADLWVPIRPGTDIPFLLGLINYAIQNNLYHHDYVVNYTNASYLVNPEFKFADGLFSGATTKDGKFSYDTSSWQYQKDGDAIRKDPTLQNPNCVFQILKRHVSVYDIPTVCKITGAPEDAVRQAYEIFCATGKPDKTGCLIYCMGVTQHTYGTQNCRATCMVQLLLGNVGRPGGGVNPQRGQSNVQGACDIGILYHVLPGYVGVPDAAKHPTLKDYIEKETPKSGYWTNKPKFLVSMLKAWYGDKATPENDFCYAWLPKLDGKDQSHIAIFERMAEGKVQGFFSWGQNPLVAGPSAAQEAEAMENLEWLVVVDPFESETAAFWKRPGADPKKIKTEVFLLPVAVSYEKEGTITNSGRWIQYRWKAVNPPGEAKSDIWIADRLFKAIRKEYQSGGRFPEPIVNLVWNYDKPGQDEPDINKICLEVNGYTVADGKPLASFAQLKDDGTTACGSWVYTGYWAADPDLQVVNCKRRNRTDKTGLGLYPKWSFAWPLNRRIVYNRGAADPAGRPWDPERALFTWDGTKWVTNDVPDFNAKVPPDQSAKAPFIMLPEGQGRLFAPGVKDGPLPTHYEPVESPVRNPLYKQQTNPLAKIPSGIFRRLAATASPEYPYIMTTHRLLEHYHTGSLTRNSPRLVELMPEAFVTISPSLAAKLGIKAGDEVIVSTARGEVKCKANVLPIVRPFKINGQEVEVVAMPWHWGYQGLSRGASANYLTPSVGDANTNIQESKAFLCNVRKA
ncbi:MAG: Formate dehydrogenase, alpha subunit [Clostridia bacterium 62_21]|nr:MAG: Formate dehydrogenase, alpha subunit [Clostridia bacterium 62_21]